MSAEEHHEILLTSNLNNDDSIEASRQVNNNNFNVLRDEYNERISEGASSIIDNQVTSEVARNDID